MQEIVPFVLGFWVLLSVVVFWLRPGRDAAILLLIGGWALLPVAVYPSVVSIRPPGTGGSMHALALPTVMLANKAVAIGLGCLAGMLLTAWPLIREVRFSRLDLPMAIWCLTPLASALANGLPPSWGLAQARYLGLAWGVPYVVGRVYLGDNVSLVKFGRGWVLAGLASSPFCLAEFVAGPFLYGWIYGSHPYQVEGAQRPFLYRPLLLLEHGNQLGMWVATVAVAAVWLRLSGQLKMVAGLPGGAVAIGLVMIALICQSHGSIALMLGVFALVWLLPRTSRRPAPWLVGASSALLAIVGTTAESKASGLGGLRDRTRDLFLGAGKQSFTWRLARVEELLSRALQTPLLGRGSPNWSLAAGGAFVNPVNLGLWLVVLGTYGLVGLLASTLALVLPIAEVVKWLPPRSWLNPTCAGVTLAAALLTIHAIDSLFNSVFLLPLLAGAGGLVTWSQRRYEA